MNVSQGLRLAKKHLRRHALPPDLRKKIRCLSGFVYRLGESALDRQRLARA
ncbi:MAG: hypothetical protein K6G15_03570 [Desulfovibrio sp.]|nr:hypothetical protein [Desulfovibrio sp.]